MKKVITSIFVISGLIFISASVTGQNSKQITEADIKKCIAEKEREARAKGYPIMDPFAARFQCIKELKGE